MNYTNCPHCGGKLRGETLGNEMDACERILVVMRCCKKKEEV